MNILTVLEILITLLLLIIPTTLLVIIFCLNMIYTNLKTRVPWVRIPPANLNKILEAINLPKDATVYDLGCGDGRFLFLAEKKGYKAIGYELAIYPYFKTLLYKFFKASKVRIERKNFFKQNLEEADAIFIFLTKSIMEKIGEKLKPNLAAGTMIVSYGFTIPKWPVKRILDTSPSKTYIY